MAPGPVDFPDRLPACAAVLVAVPFGDDVAHQAIRPGLPYFAQALLPASRLLRPAGTLAEPQLGTLAERACRRMGGVDHDTRRTLGLRARDDTLSPILPPGTAQPPHRQPGQKNHRQSQQRYRGQRVRNPMSKPTTVVRTR